MLTRPRNILGDESRPSLWRNRAKAWDEEIGNPDWRVGPEGHRAWVAFCLAKAAELERGRI